jgi:hypothetical protein
MKPANQQITTNLAVTDDIYNMMLYGEIPSTDNWLKLKPTISDHDVCKIKI